MSSAGGVNQGTTTLIDLASVRAEVLLEVADVLSNWEFPPGSDALEPMCRLVARLRAEAESQR